MSRNALAAIVVGGLSGFSVYAQNVPADAARVQALEAELRAAQVRVGELEATLAVLAADVAALKSGPGSVVVADEQTPRSSSAQVDPALTEHAVRILAPDLAANEREEEVEARPELFLQTGYAANRLDGATADDASTNFAVHRLEARWSGRVAERLGLGVEIQYHPATEGAAEELVNDAFVEYYATDALTVRVGQFVKPFGFDVQQSSSVRESPERAIFAGYFFPGQRDRGAMLAADLSGLVGWLGGATVSGGVFNGNRFFADDNDALNVNLRFRKVFPSRPFAIGASWQAGSQLLAPGVATTDRATVYGVDAQWLLGRFGIRTEYVRGTMPSTLLALEPEFTPAFEPGARSWGAAAFFDYRLSSNDDIYWRWDRFADDPVTGANVRAFNVGYLRQLGANSRIGLDYQWKDDVTFNDDELNTQFSLRWNIVY